MVWGQTRTEQEKTQRLDIGTFIGDCRPSLPNSINRGALTLLWLRSAMAFIRE